MTESEKSAWWILGVVALTLAAWFAFVRFLGNGPASQSVFALLALASVPAYRNHAHKRQFDEREIDIARKSLLAGMRAVWVVFVLGVVLLGVVKGWDTTLSVPIWMLASAVWWAGMVLLTVQSIAALVLYQGSHA
jgi:hypothetical protein